MMADTAVLLVDALGKLSALMDSVVEPPVREQLKAGLSTVERHVDALVDERRRLAERHRHLEDLSRRDEVTELYNHRYFLTCLEAEFRRAVRYMLPLSLLLAELDNFDSVNDTRGSLVANEVLRRVARAVRVLLRDTDHAARYGAGTFAILLPQTRAVDATRLGENVRHVVAGLPERVSASIGVASLGPRIVEPLDLLREAERAMAHAKALGKIAL